MLLETLGDERSLVPHCHENMPSVPQIKGKSKPSPPLLLIRFVVCGLLIRKTKSRSMCHPFRHQIVLNCVPGAALLTENKVNKDTECSCVVLWQQKRHFCGLLVFSPILSHTERGKDRQTDFLLLHTCLVTSLLLVLF